MWELTHLEFCRRNVNFIVSCGNCHNKDFRFDISERINRHNPNRKMSDLDYYENPEYQNFLISSKRRELTPPEIVFKHFNLKEVMNLVDFGMGLGYFTLELKNNYLRTLGFGERIINRIYWMKCFIGKIEKRFQTLHRSSLKSRIIHCYQNGYRHLMQYLHL